MDIYKQKWTRLQNEIFSFFCVHVGEEFSQREIAKFLGVSPTAVANSLSRLVKENLVKIESGKNTNLVSFNLDEERAIELKRVENLRQIYESGLARFLGDSFPGCAVILFGSYSLGEDTIKSDIDIAVVGCKEKDVDLAKFEKILFREVVINFYPLFKEIHKNLRENIFNGLLLSGGVEL